MVNNLTQVELIFYVGVIVINNFGAILATNKIISYKIVFVKFYNYVARYS